MLDVARLRSLPDRNKQLTTTIEVALDTDQGHKTMKKLSYIILAMASMILTSCSGEFWLGMAMGGAMFLDGMVNGQNSSATAYVPYYSSSYVGGSTYSSSTSSSTSSSSSSSSSSRHECSLCNGSGMIIRESHVATFGLDSKKYCSTCGESYMASTGHSHVTCSQCHGKGYF